jgi:hypothetical protein
VREAPATSEPALPAAGRFRVWIHGGEVTLLANRAPRMQVLKELARVAFGEPAPEGRIAEESVSSGKPQSKAKDRRIARGERRRGPLDPARLGCCRVFAELRSFWLPDGRWWRPMP